LDFLKKDIDAIKKELPELPPARVARFKKEYKLSTIDAKILADDNNLSDFMEQAVEQLVAHGEDINKERAAKLTVNWLVHKLFALLNEIHKSIDLVPFTTSQFADFLMLVASRRVNSTNAQLILKQMVATGKDAEDILNSEDLGPADSADLAGVVSKVMAKYPDQVKQFQGGKEPVIKFLVGAVMKETKGKADPVEAEKVLRNTLKS